MNEVTLNSAPSQIPDPRHITKNDLKASLHAGWKDFTAAPQFGLFFAGVYVLGGIFLLWVLAASGRVWMTIPITLGFPLIGPFIAVGLYEVSRRLERGEDLSWRHVLGVIFAQKDRQIPSMAAVIVIFFLFWNFLAHMIFALFLGLKVMTNISSSYEVFFTPHGMMMLAVGSLVGAVFSFVLFATNAISLPLLLDREVDFVTAMITSVKSVQTNPKTMLLWALFIAVLLFAGMALLFLGLFLVLPVLGHATWHIYRRILPDVPQ